MHKNYVLKVTTTIKKKIGNNLSKLFALVFDGWSNGPNRSNITFVSSPTNYAKGQVQTLLRLLAMKDETKMFVGKHKKHLYKVYSWFIKTLSKDVPHIFHNCFVNELVAISSSRTFIACVRHYYYFATLKRPISSKKRLF